MMRQRAVAATSGSAFEGIAGALERGEIEVRTQPEVWLEDGRNFGFQATAHWRRPSEGPLPSERFLPAVEGTPLSLPLARRILEASLGELERRDEAGLARSAVLSVAPGGLDQPGIRDAVVGALDETGIEPGRLCLLVPTGRTAEQFEASAGELGALRELGVRLGLSDCGAGFAPERRVASIPLGLIGGVPVDYMRLDPSLVRCLAGSASARRLAATIAATAAELDAVPVADGIETNTDVIAAFGLGCKLGQGPRFGAPMPPRRGDPLPGRGRAQHALSGARGGP